MADCPRCNATVDPQRETCPACGTSLAGGRSDGYQDRGGTSTAGQERGGTSTTGQDQGGTSTTGQDQGADPGVATAGGRQRAGESADSVTNDGTDGRLSRRQVLAGAGGVGVLGVAGWFGYPRVREFLDGEKTGWRTFRGDDARTGSVAGTEGPGESLDVAWTAEFEEVLEEFEDTTIGDYTDDDVRHVGGIMSYLSSPVIAEGVVIVWVEYRLQPFAENAEVRDNAGILGLDGETGDLAWHRLFPSLARRGWEPHPVVADGRTFVTTPLVDAADGGYELLVLNPGDGSVERRMTYEQPQAGYSPVVDGDIYSIATPSDDLSLSRVDSGDGSVEWSAELETYPSSPYPLTMAGNTIYRFVRGSDGRREIVAHDASDGSERWREQFDLPDDPIVRAPETLSPPVIADGRGYAAGGIRTWTQSFGGELVSFEPGDGSERWRFRPEGVRPDHLVSGAVGGTDTDLAEQMDDHSGVGGYPLVVDDTVVVAGLGQPAAGYPDHENDRHLYGVSDSDGALEWSAPGVVSFAPVAAGDVVYALSSDQELLSIGSDGEVHDSVPVDDYVPTSFRTPAIGNGRLYLPRRNAIVALE